MSDEIPGYRMKICIINGSPKDNSVTLRLAREFCRELNAEATVINLKDIKLKNCNGCMGCYHGDRCVIRDDLDSVMDAVASSDLAVFASPTYLFNVSTLMKVFIDRTANWGHKSPLCGKPSVMVSTADGTGAEDCIAYMKKAAYFTGSLPIGSVYCYLYEFKDKTRIIRQKRRCAKKVGEFFRMKTYKPGFDYLYHFNIKRSYIITARKRYYDEYVSWMKMESGKRYFYPAGKYVIKISPLKKLFSLMVSFFFFFGYKHSGKNRRASTS
jgi:multimeric flavodoxin WrbA